MKLRFDDFLLDAKALDLRRGERSLDVAPMAVRILLYLAERAGELVERSELYEEFWPDGFVDRERLLNTYVRQIRAALGERAGQNRFIRTYPRRGYRFVAPVSTGPVPEPEYAGAPEESPAPRRWAIGLAGAAALIALAGPPIAGPAGGAPEDPGARLSFQMGMELLEQPAPDRRALAVGHFEAVVEADPGFAAAHSGLAESLFWAGDPVGAESAARSALRLDEVDSRASLVLGVTVLNNRWAWEESERHLRDAVSTDPGNADARLALGYMLLASGRHDEARAELDAATALEPVAARITGDLGLMYGWLGDSERALELCNRTIAIEPEASWAWECGFQAARALGRGAEVNRLGRGLVTLFGGDPADVWPADGGIESRVRALRAFQMRHAGPDDFLWRALTLMDLGRREDALSALEQAVANRETAVVAIGVLPRLQPLSDDARYRSLVRQVMG